MGKKQYTSLKEVDLKDLYHSIWQFREAYQRCFTPALLTQNNVSKVLYVPAIVDLAFSLELEMKLLSLITSGKCLRGHNLFDLFYDLPEKYIGDPFFAPSDYVSEQLKKLKDIYYIVRYSFECKSCDVNSKNFLGALEKKMFNFIEQEYKE